MKIPEDLRQKYLSGDRNFNDLTDEERQEFLEELDRRGLIPWRAPTGEELAAATERAWSIEELRERFRR